VNLYSAVKYVSVGQNSAIAVAHGAFISIFELFSQKWVRHIKFENSSITRLFELKINADDTVCAALLDNNEVYFNIFESGDRITSYHRKYVVPGEIMNFAEEPKGDSYCCYAYCAEDGVVNHYCLYADRISLHDQNSADSLPEDNFSNARAIYI